MAGDFWMIQNRSQIKDVLRFFGKYLEDWDYTRPLAWKAEAYSTSRSLSQNALFHMWCGEMCLHFSESVDVTPDTMKSLMKHKFLGTEDVVVGSTVIPGQLRSTSGLSKGEMHEFMERVYAWAVDHGVRLTNPNDSEFFRLANG